MKHALILLCLAAMCLGFCSCQGLLGGVPDVTTIAPDGTQTIQPFTPREDEAFAVATENLFPKE